MIRKYTLLFITALLGLAAGVTSCLTDDDETIALEGGVPEEILLGVWTIDDWLGPDPKGFGWDDLTAVRFNADGTFEITPDNGEKHYWKWKKNPYTGITDCISLDGYDFGWDSWGRGRWQVYFPYDATNGSDDAVCHVELSKNGTSHGGSGGIGDGITTPGNNEGGHYNGKYTAVDLGLPSGTRWATCNVGAENPEDYGYYFAWGEVEPKSTYNWSTLRYCLDPNGNKFSKYVATSSYGTVDNKTELDLEDDAAYMNWGEGWRMPSDAQLTELRNTNNCTWQWTSKNGRNGYLVTSKSNGCSLFLPAAGYYYGSSLRGAGSYGNVWSRSLYSSSSCGAHYLSFHSGDVGRYNSYRCFGQSVRPVRSGK